jgi:hypothetical protein
MRINCSINRSAPGRLAHALLSLVLALELIIPIGLVGAARAGQTQIGLHAGLSIPNMKGGTNEVSKGYMSRFGPFFGLFAEHDVRPYVTLRAEVNYSSQGGKRNGMQPIIADPSLGLPPDMVIYAAFDNETILDYIEIPLMAKLARGESPHFFIIAGPYAGFLVRAKTVTSGSSLLYADAEGTPLAFPPNYQPLPPVDFGGETNVKQDINTVDAGIAGGLGVEMPFGPGDIVFATQFSLGLTNIQRDIELNGKNQTGAVALTIGYSFPLNKRKQPDS